MRWSDKGRNFTPNRAARRGFRCRNMPHIGGQLHICCYQNARGPRPGPEAVASWGPGSADIAFLPEGGVDRDHVTYRRITLHRPRHVADRRGRDPLLPCVAQMHSDQAADPLGAALDVSGAHLRAKPVRTGRPLLGLRTTVRRMVSIRFQHHADGLPRSTDRRVTLMKTDPRRKSRGGTSPRNLFHLRNHFDRLDLRLALMSCPPGGASQIIREPDDRP